MKRVNVHIDRLVLKGLHEAGVDGIAAGLREELARQLSDVNVLNWVTSQSSKPILRIGGMKIEHGAMPRDVGVQLARTLGKGDKP
jgi:hypothetical protein